MEVLKHTKAFAEKHGVPKLDLGNYTEENVVEAIVEETLLFYQKALRTEWKQEMGRRTQTFRMKLHEWGGCNKLVAKLTKLDAKEGVMKKGDEVIAGTIPQLQAAADAWKEFMEKNTGVKMQQWKTKFPVLPIRANPVLKNITVKDRKQQWRRMGRTSPGWDSWRTEELANLPDKAIQQLLTLLDTMVLSGEVPTALCKVWNALLPIGKEVGTPLDRRPISLLSVIWRAWASILCQRLQEWSSMVVPPELHAYIRNRQAHDATVQLGSDADAHKLQGIPLYVISLDCSKAFPSVDRRQLWHIMETKGYPKQLMKIMETIYAKTEVKFRVQGTYIAEVKAKMVRGIFQGCPLSVLSFGCLLLPLVERIKHYYPDVRVARFADDLNVWSSNTIQLRLALRDIEEFFEEVSIVLNPSKTQCWATDGSDPEVKLGGQQQPVRPVLKVLGCRYVAEPGAELEVMEKKAEEIKSGLKRLKGLPMGIAAKEKAICGILGPRCWYDPWNIALSNLQLGSCRRELIRVVRPALYKGPRSPSAVVTLCLKPHLMDPLIAPFWNLLRLISRRWEMVAEVVEGFYTTRQRGCGPLASFARYLHLFGMQLVKDRVQIASGETMMIPQPNKPDGRWGHGWRNLLRAAEIIQRASHRREYQGCDQWPLDWDNSLRWHHSLERSPMQTALEMVLTGGFLTPERQAKVLGATSWCKLCGMKEDDAHCLWLCQRAYTDEKKIHTHLEDEPSYTALTGLFRLGHDWTSKEIEALQRHMANRVLFYLEKNRGARQEQIGDDDGDDNDRDGDEVDACSSLGAAAAACPSIRTGENTSRAIDGPYPGELKTQEHGGLVEYHEEGVWRIRCNWCLQTAAWAYSKAFRKRHENCEAGIMPRMKRRSPLELPGHIVPDVQRVLGTRISRQVLVCHGCGGGGSGSEANFTRFVKKHMGCDTEKGPGRKNQLTRRAKRALHESAGYDNSWSHRAKKRVCDTLMA